MWFRHNLLRCFQETMLRQKMTVSAARLLRWLTAGMMVFLGTISPASSTTEGRAPPFALGEVMIKFRAGTEAAVATSRSIQASPPNLDSLAPTARLLTERTEIPLRVKQVLSGDWVVFHIDLDMLATWVATHLRKQDEITDVHMRPGNAEGINLPDVKVFDVTFRAGSSSAKVIETAAAGAPDERIAGLVDALSKRLSLPLLGSVEAKPKHLAVRIDLQRLTLQLVERLRSFVDIVDTAQVNYIMTTM